MKNSITVSLFFLANMTMLVGLDTGMASGTNETVLGITPARTICQELLKSHTYDDMIKQSEHWKDDSSPAFRDALCLTLLDHIRSKDVLAMGEQVNALTGHDLQMVGGRCAWAIEKLLKCELPPVTRTSTPAEVSEVRRLVVKTLGDIDEKEAVNRAAELIKSAGPSDKQKLAERVYTPSRILALLADEEDVAIRRAVATNASTPGFVLTRLATQDPDEEVRKKALKNMEVTRPIINGKKNKSE